MGKRPTRNMMGRRYLMLTLVAVFCTAVPTTDLVIPEKIDFAAYSTSTSFLQAMSKSGGTEADCRTFATTTNTIRTDVKSEQGILNAKDTGEDCAAKGQDVVANAQGKLDAADKDQLAKQGVAATRLNAKKTACTASVAFNVNLDTLESEECYDSTKEQSYMGAKSTCTSATSAMTKADKAVTTAKITVKDSQREHDDALAQAAQLKSACHCRVKKEQAKAWTAASTATAAHAADWKQAHEVVCALDSATSTTCDIQTCPTVTQPTLSKDVSNEDCTQAQIDAPTPESTAEPSAEPPAAPACAAAPDIAGCFYSDTCQIDHTGIGGSALRVPVTVQEARECVTMLANFCSEWGIEWAQKDCATTCCNHKTSEQVCSLSSNTAKICGGEGNGY